jgi:hypothetical protein
MGQDDEECLASALPVDGRAATTGAAFGAGARQEMWPSITSGQDDEKSPAATVE